MPPAAIEWTVTASPAHLAHRFDEERLTFRAIVETPRGSRIKFKFDEASALFMVGSVLPIGLAFPHDFGFVPSTRAADGDPLDVLILSDQELPVGCLVEARLLGALGVKQTDPGGSEFYRNDRLVAKIAESREYRDIDTLDQLGAGFTDEVVAFFRVYNELKLKKFELVSVLDAVAAKDLIRDCSGRSAATADVDSA